MVNLNLAYTSLINPQGASPVLTVPQVWQGLQRKIRFAQEFVPVILACEVLEDKDGVVKRVATFDKEKAPNSKEKASETVYSFEPAWVDFEQEDGTHIRNVVSYGAGNTDADLNMTYIFEFRFPEIAEGSDEAAKKLEQSKAMAKLAVESSISTIREMVKDGRIKA